jgi:hypothetical protein
LHKQFIKQTTMAAKSNNKEKGQREVLSVNAAMYCAHWF